MPAPCPDWGGAQEYLRDHMFDALLHHGYSVCGGRFMVHHNDWVGTTWMDTMEPDFEVHLYPCVSHLDQYVYLILDSNHGWS